STPRPSLTETIAPMPPLRSALTFHGSTSGPGRPASRPGSSQKTLFIPPPGAIGTGRFVFENRVEAAPPEPPDVDLSAFHSHARPALLQLRGIEGDFVDVTEGTGAAHHAGDVRAEKGVLAHGTGPERGVHGAVGELMPAEKAAGLTEHEDLRVRSR